KSIDVTLPLMRLRWFVLGIMLAASGKGLEKPWSKAGACVTPGGSLCRSLEFETTGWVNQSWGFHGILRYRIHRIEAVARDGTAMIREARQGFKYLMVTVENYDGA